MTAAPTLTSALDAQRLAAIAEFTDMAADFATIASEAALKGNSIWTRAYLSMLARSSAQALRISIDLGKAEAST